MTKRDTFVTLFPNSVRPSITNHAREKYISSACVSSVCFATFTDYISQVDFYFFYSFLLCTYVLQNTQCAAKLCTKWIKNNSA